MEITNEIKAKVFAQYLGQYFKVGVFNGDLKNISIETDLSNTVLVLKPLSSITDEDAIEVGKMFGEDPFIYDKTEGFIELHYKGLSGIMIWFDGEITDSETDATGNGCPIYLLSYQILQSKGYDLPQYLLGGKTLKEAGLAIYEQ